MLQGTPRNGEPLIAATQDFITGAYLLTQRNVFLTRGQVSQLIVTMCDGMLHVDLPPPAIIKPVALWTGAQVCTTPLCCWVACHACVEASIV